MKPAEDTVSLPLRIEETVAWIRSRKDFVPEVGIILGTGLGQMADRIDVCATMDYAEIPHFPVSTVESHAGRLLFGVLAGRQVVAMQGRFHVYEGYDLDRVTFPVRVMRALGCRYLFVSNACGGISERLWPGSLMAIEDHINLLGTSPLVGPNHDKLGVRWPDMSEPYDKRLLALVEAVARDERIALARGVYACLSGPQLETRAEYRMLRTLGADVVGMSTVPEVIVAVHAGLRVLGLSVVTDECVPERLRRTSIEDIIANAKKAEPLLVQVVTGVLARLDEVN